VYACVFLSFVITHRSIVLSVLISNLINKYNSLTLAPNVTCMLLVYLLYDLALASLTNGLDSSSGQTDGNGGIKATSNHIPRRKATVSLDNRTLKCSVALHFQSYPLAFVEKEQLATVSAVFINYDSIQSAMPILVTRNAEPVRRKS